MSRIFNPFSGLGKISSYIRWNRFRGIQRSVIKSKAIRKFGNRWGKRIEESLSEELLTERVAQAYRQSGLGRNLETLVLPLGQNKSDTLRISGQLKNSRFRAFGSKTSNTRAFVIDVKRKMTKRQIQRSIREQILDAFFTHYDIALKYKADFRKRFGDIDVIDIEGI